MRVGTKRMIAVMNKHKHKGGDKLRVACHSLAVVAQKAWGSASTYTSAFKKRYRTIKGAFLSMLSMHRLIYAIITFSLVIMGFSAISDYYKGFGYTLVVDGQEVAFLYEEDKDEVEAYVEDLSARAAENYQMEVAVNEDIEFLSERRPGEHVELRLVKDELPQQLSFSVYGYVLYVSGQEIVTLACESEHEELLELIKNSYVDDNGSSVVREFSIQENIVCEKELVSPQEITKVEDAANILLTGTDRRETYLVSRGDSFWSIAAKQDVTVTELKDANPQVSGDLIRPGDELNLILSEPLVNVSLVEEITLIERISYDTTYVDDKNMWSSETKVTTAGEHGEREVTYLITRENGVEIDREVLDERVIKEPIIQVVARGTATNPYSSGSGRFIWPLPAGRGSVSSYYGWRWGRMHTGVDIAAPVGTAIRAAASGTVRTSGYQGSYGNLVIISHSNGYSTYYAHNSRNLVSVGQKVTQGDTIALVGTTGYATGPHVHFEIRKDGQHLNPLRFY